MRWNRQLLFLAAVSAAPHLHAQLPSGYYAGHSALLPDSLRETYLGGRFTISVRRIARDSIERELLDRAESVMPSADSIEQSAALLTGSGHIAAFKEARAMPGERWWWRDWDGVLLSYALTGPAVAHYVERVRGLAAGPNPFARWNVGIAHRATVDYTAAVESHDGAGGRRVRMHVKFAFYCGPLCALYFEHSRLVYFDSAGHPIRIEGDASPSYMVS